MLHMDEWVESSGLSRSEVARRAGLARSTLLRISQGSISPTLATLRELAIACGLDIDATTRTLSDPDAAEAARSMLEDSYTPTDPDATAQWVARLTRTAGDDPISIVRAAGRAATLHARPGAHYLTGQVPLLRVASAGDATRQGWAISGAPPLAVAGTTVLWSADPDRAARHLVETTHPAPHPHEADIIVVPAHPGVFIDAWTDGPVRYVAPIQMLLDAFGLEDGLARAALDEARRW